MALPYTTEQQVLKIVKESFKDITITDEQLEKITQDVLAQIDLSEYATTEWVNAEIGRQTAGFATEEYVQQNLPDLTDYATTEYVSGVVSSLFSSKDLGVATLLSSNLINLVFLNGILPTHIKLSNGTVIDLQGNEYCAEGDEVVSEFGIGPEGFVYIRVTGDFSSLSSISISNLVWQLNADALNFSFNDLPRYSNDSDVADFPGGGGGGSAVEKSHIEVKIRFNFEDTSCYKAFTGRFFDNVDVFLAGFNEILSSQTGTTVNVQNSSDFTTFLNSLPDPSLCGSFAAILVTTTLYNNVRNFYESYEPGDAEPNIYSVFPCGYFGQGLVPMIAGNTSLSLLIADMYDRFTIDSIVGTITIDGQEI